ncbi:MAG: peptidylprolyl isomerase [Proteobacteria bacterium]|nr:peptidylprolyl isomerase [Pseudomonadota bacterium]
MALRQFLCSVVFLIATELVAETAPPTSVGAPEVLLDKVAGVVAGRPILYSDIKTKVDKGPLVVVSEFPLDEAAAPYDRALQDAINFQLVLSRAKELEIDVRDDEVNEDIKAFLETRNLTRDGLLEHLKQTGMTFEDYKKDFKDQMILRKFQGRVIAPLIKLTDKDVETYYLKRAGAASDLLELILRQVLISVPAGATPAVTEAKRRLAAEVHQKIADGMAFQEAVKIYSDDSQARESGGLMPPVRAKDLIGVIRSAVEPLEIGQFSLPVQTSIGFHVFLLDDKKFAGSRDFLSKKRQLEGELRNQELVEQTRHWLSEQRQRTKVELLPE